MRMAIFGAGAVGAYVGGRLVPVGVPVAFLARGDHLHGLARDGLRVDSPQGDFVVRPWLVTEDPTMVGIVDVVIVGVKTWQLPEVLHALPAYRSATSGPADRRQSATDGECTEPPRR